MEKTKETELVIAENRKRVIFETNRYYIRLTEGMREIEEQRKRERLIERQRERERERQRNIAGYFREHRERVIFETNRY